MNRDMDKQPAVKNSPAPPVQGINLLREMREEVERQALAADSYAKDWDNHVNHWKSK